VTFIATLLFLGVAVVPSSAVELLTNGNFETGNFTGWTVANLGAGDFFIDTPGTNTPPVNGIEFATAPNSLGGNWYAVSTSDLPGTHAFIQDFTVPALGPLDVVTLSFQMFVNYQSGLGPIVDPTGLDHTTGGLLIPNDNQHARVDLLKGGGGGLLHRCGGRVDELLPRRGQPRRIDAQSLPQLQFQHHVFGQRGRDVPPAVRGGG